MSHRVSGVATLTNGGYFFEKQPVPRKVLWIFVQGVFNNTASPPSVPSVGCVLFLLDGAKNIICELQAKTDIPFALDTLVRFTFAPGLTLGESRIFETSSAYATCPLPEGYFIEPGWQLQLGFTEPLVGDTGSVYYVFQDEEDSAK